MTKQSLRMLTSLALAFSILFGAGVHAKADQPPDHHGQIIVENVWATPAKEGGRSILRLRIVNESHDHEHLLGVETSVAEDARIVGRIGENETAILDSISLRADSHLDLTTDHLWIELGPLTRPVVAGESISFELMLLESRVRVEAHVHGADG